MIVVTGGAGFIGSNLVLGLNSQGYDDILVVDDLTYGQKYKNLVDCQIIDYLDKASFIECIKQKLYSKASIEAIFHQGACSDTTGWDGRYMMANNFEYSKVLLNFCDEQGIPFIYASSAAVYGNGRIFRENSQYECPLNVYGYSKYLFDQHIRSRLPSLKCQAVGLRYFNVYGPREWHKGTMASIAYHLNNQLQESGSLRLFEASDGYEDGEQRRDFIYVNDVVDVNLWFLKNRHISGIFNVGTGRSQTFNNVARAVLQYHQRGKLQYIPFPDHLKGHYQSFTEANLEALRAVKCDVKFKTVDEGVSAYMAWLNQ